MNKRIAQSSYRPSFHRFKTSGKYPSNLLMGFEMEVENAIPIRNTEGDYDDSARKFSREVCKLINSHAFLYAKYDGSVSGCEINSHPFNWNWFLKHKPLESTSDVSHFAKPSRDCGFHIHLSRKFFSKEHLSKMIYFFYANPKFIKKVSQRGGNMYYCRAKLDLEEMEVVNSSGMTPTASTMDHHACLEILDKWYQSGDRYTALNLCPRATIEIRIFQGTINAILIQAYLEFCLAISLYTKKCKFEDISVKGFKKYVRDNSNKFPTVHRTSLLNNCKEAWNKGHKNNTH